MQFALSLARPLPLPVCLKVGQRIVNIRSVPSFPAFQARPPARLPRARLPCALICTTDSSHLLMDGGAGAAVAVVGRSKSERLVITLRFLREKHTAGEKRVRGEERDRGGGQTPIQCHLVPPRPPPILDRSIREERILSAVELHSGDKKAIGSHTSTGPRRPAMKKK